MGGERVAAEPGAHRGVRLFVLLGTVLTRICDACERILPCATYQTSLRRLRDVR